MALLEDVVLTDSIEINKSSEKVFNFITGLVDDESYRAWHQEDHVALRWLQGQPWTKGSVVYAEEYIHGKLHKLKFTVTKVVPNKKIEYVPVSRFLRRYFPKNVFTIEKKENLAYSLHQELTELVGLPKPSLAKLLIKPYQVLKST